MFFTLDHFQIPRFDHLSRLAGIATKARLAENMPLFRVFSPFFKFALEVDCHVLRIDPCFHKRPIDGCDSLEKGWLELFQRQIFIGRINENHDLSNEPRIVGTKAGKRLECCHFLVLRRVQRRPRRSRRRPCNKVLLQNGRQVVGQLRQSWKRGIRRQRCDLVTIQVDNNTVQRPNANGRPIWIGRDANDKRNRRL